MSFLVAIVGRPNVGKSTLFNRITRSREAIVDEVSGVTRDNHYGTAVWEGKTFMVADTGGYVNNSDDVFEKEIQKHVVMAVDEADLILFMTDVTAGITRLDDSVAELLRRSGKKILPVVNKVDNNKRMGDTSEFYRLGLGELFCISSINGNGAGDLLDEIARHVPEKKKTVKTAIPGIAVVGRPNVGKSSFINLLLEEERCIVTPVPGTTRASVDTHFNKFGFDFTLIDTAGLRKKQQVHENIEFYSTVRTLRAIDRSDVCILLLDATEGFTGQDTYIFRKIEEAMKGVVVAVNKWDLTGKGSPSRKDYERHLRGRMKPFDDVPFLFTSVIRKQRILDTLKAAADVYGRCGQQFSDDILDETILPVIKSTPPPSVKGKMVKIYGMYQDKRNPKVFIVKSNVDRDIKESYIRFLENQLRENFSFTGVPLKLMFRKEL
ncbi:MAG: ribosome biogenesis GTPase Der [Bacteroidetes bacterium]|nr:ribosome biogenesis GTPase Der [Bacteroidota bacterium]